jgi:hypothetical protein
MSDYAHAINQFYGQAELSAKIFTALREAGKDLDALTRDDFASFDEQHDRGRETTRELARLAGLRAGMHVLDVGSGLGGPARTLAVEYGCRVTGLDLTAVFSCPRRNVAVCSWRPVSKNVRGTTQRPKLLCGRRPAARPGLQRHLSGPSSLRFYRRIWKSASRISSGIMPRGV